MKWLIPLVELAGVTSNTGGVGRRYAAVLGELARLGVHPRVVLMPDSPLVDEIRVIPGVDLVVDRRFSKLPSFLRPALRSIVFRRRYLAEGADLVFAPEWLGSAAFLPAGAPLITNLVTGIELMTEIEDSAGASRSSLRRSLQLRIQGWLERRQISRSMRTIGCSQAITNWYRGRTPMPADQVVVRNCIDVGRVHELVEHAGLPEAWPTGRPVLLHTGRVEVRKGAHVSIEAFNQIADDYPDLMLVLAGARGYSLPEWGEDGIEVLIDPHLRQRVVFLGSLPEAILYKAMKTAEVCMVPSLWEAFGNIALEVKANGTPLVVTSGSGFDDFCKDDEDALVVPPGDSEALAAAVQSLLNDAELRRRLADRASDSVQAFTAAAVAPDLRREVERDMDLVG